MKRILATILLSFVLAILNCTDISAQQAVSTRAKVEQLTKEISKQDKDLQLLQEENQDLKKQLQQLEKEVEIYREDVRQKTTELDDNMSHWLVILSIIVTLIGLVLGVLAPIFLNDKNEKKLETLVNNTKMELDSKITEVSEKARLAEDALSAATKSADKTESLKQEVQKIFKTLDSKYETVSKRVDKMLQDNQHNEENNKPEIFNQTSGNNMEAKNLFIKALSEKNPAEQIKLYDRIIQLAPGVPEPYNNRGRAKSDLGDYVGAEKDYDKAISLNPQYSDAYNNRGVLKAERGEINDAIDDYNRAIDLNPRNANAYNNRGNLKVTFRDIPGAIEDYNYSIQIKPSAPAYNNRGVVRSALNELEGAEKDYEKAIALDPNYFLAYENRANLFEKLAIKENDSARKQEYLEKARNLRKKADTLKEN